MLTITTQVPDWSGVPSPQTREQLQAELSSCQAKIADLEKALFERGQVTEKRGGAKRWSLAPLSLVLLLVCLATLLLACWLYADWVCRRII